MSCSSSAAFRASLTRSAPDDRQPVPKHIIMCIRGMLMADFSPLSAALVFVGFRGARAAVGVHAADLVAEAHGQGGDHLAAEDMLFEHATRLVGVEVAVEYGFGVEDLDGHLGFVLAGAYAAGRR